jgi:hypothetical protein
MASVLRRAENQSAQDRADDTDEDVANHAQAAAHHRRRQPTGDEADDQPALGS